MAPRLDHPLHERAAEDRLARRGRRDDDVRGGQERLQFFPRPRLAADARGQLLGPRGSPVGADDPRRTVGREVARGAI